ncbi:MAG: 6-carboxytetrahydropterin synthase [Calditrichae bacterium]|nr:6-carboxytetrahydropterin synthase [Calditrichia bacterium]
MYTVTVIRDFIAQHFLIGGDWGDENDLHSHHYKVEIQLQGDKLDQHGYLVDIVEIENGLGRVVAYFSDKTLNELAEFKDLNPSIEHFSRIMCEMFSRKISLKNLKSLTLQLWENEVAWASYLMKV